MGLRVLQRSCEGVITEKMKWLPLLQLQNGTYIAKIIHSTLRYCCIEYDMKSLEEINKVILRTAFDSSEACKGHDHTLKSKSKQPAERSFFCEHFSFRFTK